MGRKIRRLTVSPPQFLGEEDAYRVVVRLLKVKNLHGLKIGAGLEGS